MVDNNWEIKNSFERSKGSNSAPSFPHEYLVKTISSSFNTGIYPFENTENLRVLEIGSFGGNNMRFLWEKGFKKIYGIEITDSLVEMCRKSVFKYCNGGIPQENIVLGSNLNIPFDDNFFDLIISINTIHYSTENDIFEALNLWKRKLKNNGRLFIETAGPNHDFVINSKRISKNKWIWGNKGGFRKGTLAGFFDNEEVWKKTILEIFSRAKFGTLIEKSEENNLEFLTAYCIK